MLPEDKLVITNNNEHQAAVNEINNMIDSGINDTSVFRFNALVGAIQEYEAAHFNLTTATPEQVVAELELAKKPLD